MDTAIFDTGFEDTGQDPVESEDTSVEEVVYENDITVVSAAELAGEKGGVCCSYVSFNNSFSLISVLIVFMGAKWFRQSRTRRTSAGR